MENVKNVLKITKNGQDYLQFKYEDWKTEDFLIQKNGKDGLCFIKKETGSLKMIQKFNIVKTQLLTQINFNTIPILLKV